VIRTVLTSSLLPLVGGVEVEPKPVVPVVLVEPDAPIAWVPALDLPANHATLDRIARDTWHGVLDRLVSKRGLPYDRVRIDASGATIHVDRATSPTNVGLYLAALVTEGEPRAHVVQTIASLEKLERDELGFFYNWYDADDLRTVREPRFVSSVDNGNLIIALEGLLHAYRNDRTLSQRIDRILQPMRANFGAAFLERASGEKQGTLQVVRGGNAHYDRLGSEARAIVALLEAGGHLPPGSLAKMKPSFAEKDGKRVFKTWDGGVFQYLLPNVLLGESQLSRAFRDNHESLLHFLERDDGSIAAHSASDLPEGGYDGKHGIKALAEEHADLISERVVTPHAVMLTASVSKPYADRALARLIERFPDLYREGIGLFDAVDPETGRRSDSILSLDQLMSVLSTRDFGKHVRARVRSQAELYPGARTLEAVYATVPLSGDR
jgi:hypothetical protein